MSNYGQRPAHFRSETKKRHTEEHHARLEWWQQYTPEQQLDARLGKGQGATKQRKRIAKQLEA